MGLAYVASFVDLDEDHNLDLLVTSDFAGTDIYLNDGTGHFTDKTNALLEESVNFGMGHTFADYDLDGALDFFVIGMASTTVRRLNQMGLIRPDRPEYLEMRTRMGYGGHGGAVHQYVPRGQFFDRSIRLISLKTILRWISRLGPLAPAPT